MSTFAKIVNFEVRDLVRSKWLPVYGLTLFVIGEGLLRYSGTVEQAVVGVGNIVLLVVPIVSLVFGASYLYGSSEFTELMLTQPVKRTSLFYGLYTGLSIPLVVAAVAGTGLPFLLRIGETGYTSAALLLVGVSFVLTLIFVSLAFLIALKFDDKARGLGTALFVWFFMTVIFDGIVLMVVQAFKYYPLEKTVMLLMIANPADLSRVLMLLVLDASAMMGYTGAVVERFLGSAMGIAACIAILLVWLLVPLLIAKRVFDHKDF